MSELPVRGAGSQSVALQPQDAPGSSQVQSRAPASSQQGCSHKWPCAQVNLRAMHSTAHSGTLLQLHKEIRAQLAGCMCN